MTRSPNGISQTMTGSRENKFEMRVLRQNPVGESMYLLRLVDNQPSKHFGIISGDNVEIFRTDSPLLLKTVGPIPFRALMGILGVSDDQEPWVLLFGDYRMVWLHRGHRVEADWRRCPHYGSSRIQEVDAAFSRLCTESISIGSLRNCTGGRRSAGSPTEPSDGGGFYVMSLYLPRPGVASS